MKALSLILLVCFYLNIDAQSCSEQVKLLPPVPESFIYFGKVVALDGDRAVFGTPNGNGDTGSVNVFDWDGTNWNPITLLASNASVGDSYGFDVAVDGDRVIVGSPFADSNHGAVYVYDWDGANWIETSIITASDGASEDRFGWSLDVEGDRIIVGAIYDDDSGSDSGSLYVYDWDGSNWVETKLSSSTGQVQDFLGWECSLEGNSFIVSSDINDAGQIHHFELSGSTWSETIISASDGLPQDNFGSTIDFLDDRIITGTPGRDEVANLAGAVYIYDWNGSAWIETKILASDGQEGDLFGSSVALEDDKFVSGARGDDDNGNFQGAIYLLEWDGSSWSETKYHASDGMNSDALGWGASISGDRFIAGAQGVDGAFSQEGAAYIFECCSTSTTYYFDGDGDGFGDNFNTIDACTQPSGYVVDNTDCDDTDANNFPGNTEVCDGLDNNCDGVVDEGVTQTFYEDIDQDGFGNPNSPLEACSEPPSFVADNTDCDDFDPNNYPGNSEVCDGQDNNCNGIVDEGAGINFYADTDNDGFGDSNNSVFVCSAPSGYVTDNTDCDDTDSNNFPGNTEVCDGQDNNCDGIIDEGVGQTYYADSDTDGFGDSNNALVACTQPFGYVVDNTDCDDMDADNFPGNIETCDGKDNNCDGVIDEGVLLTFYFDADSDGYGDPTHMIMSCSLPSGYANNDTDCDDADPNNYPGNTEICDGQDNNCDGIVDEGCGPPPPCDSVYLVIPVLLQDTYRAEINLQSDAIINSGNNILYTAGTDIDLTPNFEVILGTVFEAKIQPCDNN